MNLGHQRLVRIRRVHTVLQIGFVLIVAAILTTSAHDWAGKGAASRAFRREFSAHRVDLERGGSPRDHETFFRDGSRAHIDLERAFIGMLLLLSGPVLAWLALGAALHRRYALALEGMPEESGGLRALGLIGWFWFGTAAAVVAGAAGYSWALLSGWEALLSAPVSTASFDAAQSGVQQIKTATTAWIATLLLSFALGLMLSIQGVLRVVQADRRSRLRRLESDVLY